MIIESGWSVIKIDNVSTQLRIGIMTPAFTDEVYYPPQSAEVYLNKEKVTDLINALVNLQKDIR